MNNSKFLFILCLPFSGSTLITKLIGTSKNASIFSSTESEGQKIPELGDIMLIDDRWNPNIKFPWQKIKEIFMSHWDLSKPILVEKSPPNIIRTQEIIKEFHPIFFIASIRNPYAFSYSFHRRSPDVPFSHIAKRWVSMAKFQISNIENLDNILFFTYEDLTNHPETISAKIANFIPELHDLDIHAQFTIHSMTGSKRKPIQNFNNIAISQLSSSHILELNQIFEKEKHVMDYFLYDFL